MSPPRRFVLDDADREEIESVARLRQGPWGDVYALERDRSGRHGSIMKYNLNAERRETAAGADDQLGIGEGGGMKSHGFCRDDRLALALAAPRARTDCAITIGVVMELTGPAGEYGQAGAKSVEMAFRDLNDAGGPHGCKLVADTRDSQSQGALAVDAANQLVQLKKVPVIIGGIISSVSIPILTSVTGPAKIVQVSPASSSPTLTNLGREGKTNGMFFRTITSDALQGTAAAKYALDQGFKKIAVIHVNNDFGINMFTEFAKVYKALGGEIVSVTPYNEKQSSYDAEASEGSPPSPTGFI